jgi:hypothetical protein
MGNEWDMHSASAFIKELKSLNIPFKLHELHGIIDAIYWADHRLLGLKSQSQIPHLDLGRIRVIVHDTTFAVVHLKSGYEKFSVLATIEPGGHSRVLVCGVSVSDNHLYFDKMLELFLEVYPMIPKDVVVMSDEDMSFINSCKTKLGKEYYQMICAWHKLANWRRKRVLRKLRGTKQSQEQSKQ